MHQDAPPTSWSRCGVNSMPNRYLESVILGENRGFISWLLRAFLLPLAIIYRVGLWAYLLIYRLGIRKRCKLNVSVISVGNLTFGGTGKTPAVQTICRVLTEQGKRVVILSRGHGGSAQGAIIASDGERIFVDSSVAGDEPILLARTLPGIPIVVGRDRRESGKLACEQFAPDVIVLDDGMQYWQLNRDLDIVVLDAKKPFGSGFVMPMGDLREPASGLNRAGVILLANARAVDDAHYSALIDRIAKLAPNAKIFRCAREAVCFTDALTGERIGLEWAKRRSVLAFCGIGKPISFLDMLDSLGAFVARSVIFPDHYRLSCLDGKRIIDEADACDAQAIVTTEKDIARLGESIDIPTLYALVIRLEIEDGASFAQHITNWING